MSQEDSKEIESLMNLFEISNEEAEELLAIFKERRAKKNLIICRDCGNNCKTGKVLKNKTVVSQSDEFGGTVSDRGFPQMLDCFKCENCGHSFISKKS